MGIGNFLKDALGTVKDSGASAAIKSWLARELADYGEVLDFSINSRERDAQLRILLKGEREPLTVFVEQYEIILGETPSIVVRRARASREWVNAVLRKFVIDRRHPIPPQYAGVAKLVLNG